MSWLRPPETPSRVPAAASASSSSSPSPAKRGLSGLVGVIGIAGAAFLFTSVPAEESGRKVEARVVEASAVQPAAIELEHKAGDRHLKAYRDIVGVWTACDGIAYVPANAVYSPAQCDAMLERELVKHAEGILACTPALKAQGRDYQRAAAVSLAYNIGVGAFCRSTAARRFTAGQWAQGCAAFAMWNKAGGAVVRGLERRRAREREACETNLIAGKTPANLEQRLKRLA